MAALTPAMKAAINELKTAGRDRLDAADAQNPRRRLRARVIGQESDTRSSAPEEDETQRGRDFTLSDIAARITGLGAKGGGATIGSSWIKGKEGQPDGYLEATQEAGGYACSIGGKGECFLPLDEQNQMTDEASEKLGMWWKNVRHFLREANAWIGYYVNPVDSNNPDETEINISLVFHDEETATNFGRSVWQDSIFDLAAQDTTKISYDHLL